MKKRILVCGGAGFIGSHLCRALVAQQQTVLCLDNLSTGNLDNITDLLARDNFSFIKHDITIPIDIDVDQIYNLACIASPKHYQKDALHVISTCVHGVINLLDLATQRHIPMLQASTSEVYGNPLIHPQTEGYWGNVNPIGPRACYDEGKRIAETLLFEYHRKYGTSIKIVRIFNTYGPFMCSEDGRLIPTLIHQALYGKDITVYGDGMQTRSFCYIRDLIEGLVKFMALEAPVTGPINLGNPEEIPVIQVAEKIMAVLQSRSRIVFSDLPVDDPIKRKPDISVAAKTLNWVPSVKFDEGLKKTIQHYRKRLHS